MQGWTRQGLLVALLVMQPFVADAQVTTVPVAVEHSFEAAINTAALDALDEAYNAGNWSTAVLRAGQLMAAVGPGCEATRQREEKEQAKKVLRCDLVMDGVDAARHHLLLVWISRSASGDPALARMLYHQPANQEPFLLDLPGAGAAGAEVYEVFLSRTTGDAIASAYSSARDKDPGTEALAGFVQSLATAALGSIGGFLGPVRVTHDQDTEARAVRSLRRHDHPDAIGQDAPPHPWVGVSLSKIGLPYARATVKWEAVARSAVAVEDFKRGVEGVASTLRFSEVPRSPCGRLVVDRLASRTAESIGRPECLAGTALNLAACTIGIDEALADAVSSALRQKACSPATRDTLVGVRNVEAAFRNYVATGLTATAKGSATFRNRPLTHWSLGAGVGVLTWSGVTKPRVKAADGVLVADPLSRSVTMSFVSYSRTGFDAELDRVTRTERVRPFVGAAIAPDFGVVSGCNVLLAKGIGVTVGGVLMFSKGTDADLAARPSADGRSPFQVAYSGGLLLGISYNFK